MLIFDIGANRGLFTDKCLQLHENIHVVAVEANPRLSDYLRLKYKDNDNVTVLNNIVAEKSGELVDFYICTVDTISTASKDWVSNSRFAKDFNWYTPMKIPSESVDSLVKSYGIPDILKIDVEGYEYEVIKGMTCKLKDLCFEWAEEQYDNINKTCEHLAKIGYTDFGYILCDDYLVRPDVYTTWEASDFHDDIDPDRKGKWGMIWSK